MRFPIFFLPAIMSGIAVLDMPFGYYTLLRIVICGSGAFGAFLIYTAYRRRWFSVSVTAVPAIIALLYNPLIPVHLTRDIWFPINLSCVLLFSILALLKWTID